MGHGRGLRGSGISAREFYGVICIEETKATPRGHPLSRVNPLYTMSSNIPVISDHELLQVDHELLQSDHELLPIVS